MIIIYSLKVRKYLFASIIKLKKNPIDFLTYYTVIKFPKKFYYRYFKKNYLKKIYNLKKYLKKEISIKI